MQEDARDLMEVLIFDEIEETVGTWLRTIIQRLERERTAIRRDLDKQPTPSRERLRGTPLYQEQHPKCGNPACATAFRWAGRHVTQARAGSFPLPPPVAGDGDGQ
jgi:hypothetical protein